MATKRSIPKELETDWTDQPGKQRYSRIHRMMASNDTRHLNNYDTMEKNPDPQPNFSVIYGIHQKKWQKIGQKCLDCGKALKDEQAIKIHPEICSRSLKINKDNEEEEILKLVRRN